jgi:hypothetical protein
LNGVFDWVLWLEVVHPVDVSPNPILILDLAGNGELVILFRDALAILFDHLTDTDSPEYWRCNG